VMLIIILVKDLVGLESEYLSIANLNDFDLLFIYILMIHFVKIGGDQRRKS
jgi:hypothetical protein